MCLSLLISADEKPILDKGGAYSSTTTTQGGTYTQHYHKEGHIHSTTTRSMITNALHLYKLQLFNIPYSRIFGGNKIWWSAPYGMY